MTVSGWPSLVHLLVSSARTQWLVQRAHPMTLIIGVAQPAGLILIATASWHHLDPATVSRFAIGSGLCSLWAGTIWSAGGILRREVESGTLARIVASPRDARLVLVAKSFAASGINGLAVAGTTTALLIALGHRLQIREPGWFALSAAATLLSATALGLLLSCLFVVSRAAVRISEALSYPVFLLGGMIFPLSFLPLWLRWPSALISLHWADDLLMKSASGGPLPATWLAMLATLTLTYAGLGAVAFGRVMELAREKGLLTLG